MRPIKFRAWSRRGKMIIYDLNSPKLIDGELKAYDSKDYIIMQFTGLKDCKGTEIYEGDIIKTSRFNNNLYVKWDYDQWSLFDGICNELSIDPDFDEVIGCVYENPELLEVAS